MKHCRWLLFGLSRLKIDYFYPYKLRKPPERVVLVININQSVT